MTGLLWHRPAPSWTGLPPPDRTDLLPRTGPVSPRPCPPSPRTGLGPSRSGPVPAGVLSPPGPRHDRSSALSTARRRVPSPAPPHLPLPPCPAAHLAAAGSAVPPPRAASFPTSPAPVPGVSSERKGRLGSRSP